MERITFQPSPVHIEQNSIRSYFKTSFGEGGDVKTKGPKLLKVTGKKVYRRFTMTGNVGFIKDVLITEIFCKFFCKFF